MIYYEEKGFIDYYMDFLEAMCINNSRYIDPDSVDDVGKTTYYSDLTDFLNAREEWLVTAKKPANKSQ